MTGSAWISTHKPFHNPPCRGGYGMTVNMPALSAVSFFSDTTVATHDMVGGSAPPLAVL